MLTSEKILNSLTVTEADLDNVDQEIDELIERLAMLRSLRQVMQYRRNQQLNDKVKDNSQPQTKATITVLPSTPPVIIPNGHPKPEKKEASSARVNTKGKLKDNRFRIPAKKEDDEFRGVTAPDDNTEEETKELLDQLDQQFKKQYGSKNSDPAVSDQQEKSLHPRTVAANERRKEMVRYVTKHGPQKVLELGAACGIPQGSMTALVNHEWFERENGRVNVSSKGHQDVIGKDKQEEEKIPNRINNS